MAYPDLTAEWLTGLIEPPLLEVCGGLRLHPDAASAFLALAKRAKTQGFDLRLVSGWRGFSHQARIWQAKWQGARPVLDLQSQPIELSHLSHADKTHAILLYSAFPGTSRHHWGSDLDWYDAAAVDAAYRPQLLAAEYTDGPFRQARLFIEQHGAEFGFFAPYDVYRGGVAAEPWHLSFIPLASACAAQLNEQMVQDALQSSLLDDKTQLASLLPDIFQRYVRNVAPLPDGVKNGQLCDS